MNLRHYPGRMKLLIVLFSLVVASAFAQQPLQTTLSAERLREHVTYLASDKLEGRRTGGSGANLAAEYIAREFARYGLRRSVGRDLPGMSHLEADSPRRYMQEFPYVAGVELGKGNFGKIKAPFTANKLSFTAGDGSVTNLPVGEDWMPLGFSANGRIEKAAGVFVGFGISAAELKHDDYSGVDATGKIAIAFVGTPDGDNPHGQFARYEEPRWKAIAAKNAGAKALILISQQEQFTDERLSQLRYDNSAGDGGLPVVIVSSRTLLPNITGSDLAVALGSMKKGVMPQVNVKALITLSTDIVRKEVSAWNVIGILDGSDPTLKNEAVIIGAHYDHLGRGGAGSLATREGEIHHGADDNASGVAGVLELARFFTSPGHRPRRTIVFIAFSGEEEGLLGSNYYVNHPIIPLADTVAMLNMDMIGRMKSNKLNVGGVGTAQNWREFIKSANASEQMNVTASGEAAVGAPIATTTSESARTSMPIVTSANGRTIVTLEPSKPFELALSEDGFGPSDHSSFYAKQIPVLFFWTGTHDDYHKPSDTADKIKYDDEERILHMVARLVNHIDADDKRPVYTVAKTESAGRSTGFRVYLGTIPNYADSNDGLLLDGVRDDSPAAKAGLKAGDKVVKLAGRDLRNVYDYTSALGEMKAGQEYEVEIMRGSERLRFKITPAARK